MIRLGQSMDGRLILGSTQPFPADVKYVEYHKDQRLFNLVFDTEDEQSELMPLEVSPETDQIVRASPNIMVIAMAAVEASPFGYLVPLIQIGI